MTSSVEVPILSGHFQAYSHPRGIRAFTKESGAPFTGGRSPHGLSTTNQVLPEKRVAGKAYFFPVRVLSESFGMTFKEVGQDESTGRRPVAGKRARSGPPGNLNVMNEIAGNKGHE